MHWFWFTFKQFDGKRDGWEKLTMVISTLGREKIRKMKARRDAPEKLENWESLCDLVGSWRSNHKESRKWLAWKYESLRRGEIKIKKLEEEMKRQGAESWKIWAVQEWGRGVKAFEKLRKLEEVGTDGGIRWERERVDPGKLMREKEAKCLPGACW